MSKEKLLYVYVATVIVFVYFLVDALRSGQGRITYALTSFMGVSGLLFVTLWLVATPFLLLVSRRIPGEQEEPDPATAIVTSPLIKINGQRWVQVTSVEEIPSPIPEAAQTPVSQRETVKHETARHETVRQKYGVGDVEKVMSLRRQTDKKGKPTPIRVISELTGISSATVGRIVKQNSI